MSAGEILAMSVCEAAAAVRDGTLSPLELSQVYRGRAEADRNAGADGLNCFLWVAPEAPRDGPVGDDGGAALASMPIAV